MNPRYPVYIPSKGRADNILTAKALDGMRVPFRVVVEPTEAGAYRAAVGADRVLALPFADLGQGSVPARNWIWEHAKAGGHARHWVLDDNMWAFYRLNRNAKTYVADGTVFRCAEDFVDRFANVPMSGFHYHGFADQRHPHRKPFALNTRVYSCILLANDLPPPLGIWRGRYNEDTDLSLRLLKAGYCTILFLAFLAEKCATMRMRGGNTDELYKKGEGFDGRLEMARSLQAQHPDVVRVVRKWGRWQHQVDYRPFKRNRLVPRPGLVLPDGHDDYGMRLIPAARRAGSREGSEEKGPSPRGRPGPP